MARKLIVELVGKGEQFSKSLDAAGKKAESFGKKAGALGSKMTKSLTLPIVAAGAGAFKMASDLNEAMSAADVRFGKNARAVQDWSKNLDSAFGLTRREALDMVTQLRAVTQNSKLTDDQMFKLAERAADVGSQFNMASNEVGERFRSAMTGSSEVLEQFGVDTKVGGQGMIDYAASIGKTVAKLTSAEKQMGIYNIIMKETSVTQGDATKTADTAAGQMRILKTEFGNTAAEIGQKLIPAGTNLIGKLNGIIGKLDATGIGADKVLIALLALAAAGPILKGIELAMKGVAAAQWAWNAAVHAHPLMALVGATIVLHEWLERATGGLDGVRQSLFSWNNPIKELTGRFEHLVDLLNKVRSKIPGIGFSMPKLPFMHTGGVVPGPAGMSVPIMAQAGERVSSRGSSGGGVVVNVYGSVIAERDLGRTVADALRDNGLMGVT